MPGSDEFGSGWALGVRTAAFVSGLPPNLLRPPNGGFSELAAVSAGLMVVGAGVVVEVVVVVVVVVLTVLIVEIGTSFGELSARKKERVSRSVGQHSK